MESQRTTFRPGSLSGSTGDLSRSGGVQVTARVLFGPVVSISKLNTSANKTKTPPSK